MGLLQRSFLDLVEVSQPQLQVVLVIDGTDSMSDSLAGMRNAVGRMVEDLRRYRGERVSFQLVVYRDVGARSGEVVFPLQTVERAFTADPSVLQAGVDKLQPETGAPYFPELIDLGIHEALTKLPWSSGADTTRWLMVFADAPPYDPGFNEPATGARRRIDTEQLIAVANRQGVKINCILCASRAEDRPAQEKMLEKTQQFLNRLATDTGGLMLDLSYPDVRRALEKAAAPAQVGYRQIGRITAADVAAAKRAAAEQQTAWSDNRRLRFAVLPHLPLAEMVFDPARPEVQLSAELRQKLRQLPGAEVKSPVAVERQLESLRARGLDGPTLLQTLATVLDVDYVVWGELRGDAGSTLIRSAIYDRATGRQLVQESLRTGTNLPITQAGGQLAANLARAAAGSGADRRLAMAFSRVPSDERLQRGLLTPVSNVTPARNEVLTGFETLERALAYPVGDPQALELLAQAATRLNRAAETTGDPTNPLIQVLLASCLFNEAQSLLHAGRADEAAAKSRAAFTAVNNAYRFRSNTDQGFLKNEIEADYALLVKKDHAAAIQLYQQLEGGDPQTPLNSALRATWTLAGIYSGDWGTPAKFVDETQARQRLIRILAGWPDSREAQFIRRNLRWDEAKGESQFTYFPQEQTPVVQQMAATAP
jgi:tetratricopeptide (TPR) repeat protein